MDWLDLVPEDIAFEQFKFDRRAAMARARRAGLTYPEIGKMFKTTSSAARFNVIKHESTIKYNGRPGRNYLSPVEKYLDRTNAVTWFEAYGMSLICRVVGDTLDR